MNEQTPVERKGMTPVLRMAVLSGVKASVQLHLRLGGDVDATDDKGRTPLILAASRGHAEICRLLLDAGADLAHIDMEGNDALRAATAKGHHAVAELIRAFAAPLSAPPPVPVAVADDPDVRDAGGCGPASLLTSEPVPEEEEAEPAVGVIETVEPDPVQETDPVGTVAEPSTAVPDGTPGVLAPAVGHGAASSHSRQDAEEFDLSGWEEEMESSPPPADPTCAGLADELQRRLSLHIPVDLDAGWDDVDIDLPDILVSVRRRAKLDGDEEAALRELVLAAVADGRVRGEFLALVAPRDQDDPDVPDPDYVANLRVMLGDMGVIVDDNPAAPDRPGESGDSDDEDDRLREEAAEGMAFLRILNSNRADPLTHYIGGLPRDRLTRDDEASLAMEIERGTKAALAAVAKSPAAVSELLAVVEAVIGGATPPEDVLESDERTARRTTTRASTRTAVRERKATTC